MLAGVLLGAWTLVLAACSGQSAPGGATALEGQPPSGRVEMHQVQAAYIASGNVGSGVLYYQGHSYPFTVGGAGIGGIGASTLDATGDVYHLSSLGQFPGSYAQGRYGFAFGTQSGGDLWMQNENGVVMHLKAKRTGLMLSLGGDAIFISMK